MTLSKSVEESLREAESSLFFFPKERDDEEPSIKRFPVLHGKGKGRFAIKRFCVRARPGTE